MADVNAPAAESSTATMVAPSDPSGYAEWRQTGKLPAAAAAPAERKPKEASAPSQEKSAAGSESAEKGAPASEAGKEHQEHKARGNAESRLNELLADLKRAGLTPSELKTFKREAEKQAEPKAAPEKTEKPAASQSKKPNPDDFPTYEECIEALADYKAGERLEGYKQQQQAEARDRYIKGKLAEAETRYGAGAAATVAEAAKTFDGDAQIHGSVKAVLESSPVIVDLLYVMSSKPEEFQGLVNMARTNPVEAIRKIVLLERLVTEELAKGGGEKSGAGEGQQRGEDGKFKSQAGTPEKKVSGAPPPPKEVSGNGTAPSDEVETAAKSGDFRAYKEAQNRRDLARRRG